MLRPTIYFIKNIKRYRCLLEISQIAIANKHVILFGRKEDLVLKP